MTLCSLINVCRSGWLFCELMQLPPEAQRSKRLKENLDVLSQVLFSARFMSLHRESGKPPPLPVLMSASQLHLRNVLWLRSYPPLHIPVCPSVRLSPWLWTLKSQGRLIRMQRRKALLQIENILILLMLGGRGGERQRYRGGKGWGERKEGEMGWWGGKWRLKYSDPHGGFITVCFLPQAHSIDAYITYDSVTWVERSMVSMATGSGQLCYKLVRVFFVCTHAVMSSCGRERPQDADERGQSITRTVVLTAQFPWEQPPHPTSTNISLLPFRHYSS